MVALSSEVAVEVYPRRPITLVVGGAPGGGVDVLARYLATFMADDLGQRIIIENRPGAAGMVAALSMTRADPDGYTVYMAGSSVIIHQLMYRQGEVDVPAEFRPVGKVAGVPVVLVKGKHLAGSTLIETLELARQKSVTLRCASAGAGSVGDFLCDALQKNTGVQVVHVPYKVDGQALVDLMEGRLDFYANNVISLLPHIQADHVHAVAVVSEGEFSKLGDVPSIEASGILNATVPSWFGLVTPKQTPDHVIARLNRSLNTVISQPEVRERLMDLGFVVSSSAESAESLEARIASDTEQWSEILRHRGITGAH